MCTARKGVKDLPISAQGLPAVRRAGLPAVIMEGLPAVRRAGLPAVIFTRRPSGGLVRRFYGGVADWRAVLGKSGCCEEECKPLIIRDAGGAPRESPWHQLVSPIRFANGGT